MKRGECPNCTHEVEVGDSPLIGNCVRCKDCGVELMIVWLNPLELDFASYSEDDYIYEDYQDYEG